MSAPRHLRSAFAFRAGYLALAWLGLVAFADPEAEGAFARLVLSLAWALPVLAPLMLWFDWRWLRTHPGAVNRFGLKRPR